ncbi:hypothetical protein J8273_3074 [Carpediemonas membranifera]|uniref:Uncharacterized protein n=1 Tax=Carpediemonas membranifera TaxID=201153 RepID=A0A8J6E356_9EUKA|nr:hypothetical protein J8273_3074 [Carpediemonas membranifera]|eukprot:KAG9395498.1 hypothetical protein J8273_3074 [Carpediemonas membranifera]
MGSGMMTSFPPGYGGSEFKAFSMLDDAQHIVHHGWAEESSSDDEEPFVLSCYYHGLPLRIRMRIWRRLLCPFDDIWLPSMLHEAATLALVDADVFIELLSPVNVSYAHHGYSTSIWNLFSSDLTTLGEYEAPELLTDLHSLYNPSTWQAAPCPIAIAHAAAVDDGLLVCGSTDTLALIPTDGQTLRSPKPTHIHRHPVPATSLSAKGRMALLGLESGALFVSMNKGKIVPTSWPTVHRGAVTASTPLAQDSWASMSSRTVVVHTPLRPTARLAELGVEGRSLLQHDANTLIVGGAGGRMYLWDTRQPKPALSIRVGRAPLTVGVVNRTVPWMNAHTPSTLAPVLSVQSSDTLTVVDIRRPVLRLGTPWVAPSVITGHQVEWRSGEYQGWVHCRGRLHCVAHGACGDGPATPVCAQSVPAQQFLPIGMGLALTLARGVLYATDGIRTTSILSAADSLLGVGHDVVTTANGSLLRLGTRARSAQFSDTELLPERR